METDIAKKVKAVYDRLQDDESRMIFQKRLLHYLSGDEKHLADMLEELGGALALAKKRLRTFVRPVVVYGAGRYSEFIVDLLKTYGIVPDCICDTDSGKHGAFLCGMRVISPKELVEVHKDSYIIIAVYAAMDEIYDWLIGSGFPEKNIFKSNLYTSDPYFGTDCIPLSEKEVYVDAGCYDGDSILSFLAYCGGKYKKIYAFEPNFKSFEKTKKLAIQYDVKGIEIINKGVWSHDKELTFSLSNDFLEITDAGDIKVQVTSIDKALSGGATFMKMDIEGAELEALKGAEETIRKYKPKLAICIYHKPEDILEIPLYINSIEPGYKFYIRHHTISVYDTVLYAIV